MKISLKIGYHIRKLLATFKVSLIILRVLLGSDRAQARSMIENHQFESLIADKNAFNEQKVAEMECFGTSSYWRRNVGAEDVPMNDI